MYDLETQCTLHGVRACTTCFPGKPWGVSVIMDIYLMTPVEREAFAIALDKLEGLS